MIRLPLRLLASSSSSRRTTSVFIRLSSTAANSITSTPGVPVTVPVEDKKIAETVTEPHQLQKNQAPNRAMTWSHSQRERSKAMIGPRFEQTELDMQPMPYAAIELIHEQPVRFIPERVAVCDGGGGPLGHPKVFINVDKPEVVTCNYCSLPYAHLHNKKAILASGDCPFPILE